jgi:hypothetical protein
MFEVSLEEDSANFLSMSERFQSLIMQSSEIVAIASTPGMN